MHHVLDSDLCTAKTVVVLATADAIADKASLGVLNLVIGRLAARHVLAIVVCSAVTYLETLDQQTYPHISAARLVESEGEAAHLILDGMRLPH